MFLQLPTGKTVYVSAFEYLFLLKEEEVDEFYQACIADDLGEYMEDPFSNRMSKARIMEEEVPEIEEVPNQDIEI